MPRGVGSRASRRGVGGHARSYWSQQCLTQKPPQRGGLAAFDPSIAADPTAPRPGASARDDVDPCVAMHDGSHTPTANDGVGLGWKGKLYRIFWVVTCHRTPNVETRLAPIRSLGIPDRCIALIPTDVASRREATCAASPRRPEGEAEKSRTLAAASSEATARQRVARLPDKKSE